MARNRLGFTLTELLVVIAILILLTSVVVVAMGNTRSSDRVRSSARAAQSSFLGARDRASQAKETRGIRLQRDSSDPTLINGFQYVRPLPSLYYGAAGKGGAATAFSIRRLNNAPEAIIIAGLGSSIDWFQLDSSGVFDLNSTRVRIPAGENGSWYRLVPLQNQPPFFVQKSGTIQLMRLAQPFLNVDTSPPNVDAVLPDSPKASMELQLGNEVSPFTEPMPLPTGMVIDLKWSSASAKALVSSVDSNGALAKIDLMFTPRGNITGPASVMGPIHFLIHDLQDAVSVETVDRLNNWTLAPVPDGQPDPLSPISPRNRSDKIILTIFPATGNVQSFPIDSTDVVNNADGSAGPDGLPDDLFRLARNGSGT
jgi:type II secretory pathway pseudopilin PulG